MTAQDRPYMVTVIAEKQREIAVLRAENEELQAAGLETAHELAKSRAENERLLAGLETERGLRDAVKAENERLRTLLKDCIKSAEDDDPDSGWWDEQSIEAINAARIYFSDRENQTKTEQAQIVPSETDG